MKSMVHFRPKNHFLMKCAWYVWAEWNIDNLTGRRIIFARAPLQLPFATTTFMRRATQPFDFSLQW
jgi:hypothetical protein